MRRRQTMAEEWLIVTDLSGMACARRLPRGSGVLLLADLPARELRRLRLLAQQRGLAVITERSGEAARVHNRHELRSALLRRVPVILLSPMYPTASHPGWQPIPRMRAAAMARLSRRKLIALGGMNRKRYAAVAQLGFVGWAGISAFRT